MGRYRCGIQAGRNGKGGRHYLASIYQVGVRPDLGDRTSCSRIQGVHEEVSTGRKSVFRNQCARLSIRSTYRSYPTRSWSQPYSGEYQFYLHESPQCGLRRSPASGRDDKHLPYPKASHLKSDTHAVRWGTVRSDRMNASPDAPSAGCVSTPTLRYSAATRPDQQARLGESFLSPV